MATHTDDRHELAALHVNTPVLGPEQPGQLGAPDPPATLAGAGSAQVAPASDPPAMLQHPQAAPTNLATELVADSSDSSQAESGTESDVDSAIGSYVYVIILSS
jgi:hypothetical protein